MKFALVAISVLSAAFMSHAAALPNKEQDTSSMKIVSITCQNVNRAKICLSSLRTVEQRGAQDRFSQMGLYDNTNEIEGDFYGSRSTAEKLLRELPGCGLQECPDAMCIANSEPERYIPSPEGGVDPFKIRGGF